MAKWLSARSERRWNHAASIVEAANAGNRFVPGLYRAPIRAVACPDLDLAPGSYPAVAGATIAAGASGGVLYSGKVYTATNQSLCNVAIGNRVGLHVSPACEAFFVPCTCDCGEPPTPAFCDTLYAICINGEVRLMAATEGGNTQVWDLSECCPDHPCPVESVSVTLTCDPMAETVTYLVEWGASSATGNFSSLPVVRYLGNSCDDPPGVAICAFVFVAATTAAGAAAFCGTECSPTPPEDQCCDRNLWFCVNNESVQLPVDGGTHTWDVSACCACTTASLEINLSCNPTTDVITLSWEFICDGGPPETGAENTLMSLFCESNDQRIITLVGASCFLQISATIIETACAACEPTPTTPPPP